MLRAFLKDTAIYGLSDFLLKFASFAIFPLFTYALSVGDFGIFSLVTTLSSLLGLLFNGGLSNAVQRLSLDPKTLLRERPLIITTGLICLLVSTGLISVAALWLAYQSRLSIFENHQITFTMLSWGILSAIALQINTFCMDVVRLNFQPWRFTILSFIQNSLLIGLSFYFVCKMGWGVTGYLASIALAYLLNIPFCLGMIRANLTCHFNFQLAKEMLRFGYPLIFSGLGYWLFGSMDRWMLGDLSNNIEVGFYSVAFKLASVLVMLNYAFGQAWSPRALHAYSTDPFYRKAFSHFFTIWFFILLVVSSMVIFFSQEFFIFLTPTNYWPAASLMPFIGMSLVCFGTTQISAMGITLEKQTHHFLIASWLAAGVNFFLNLMLIPDYGAFGAAFATLISSMVLALYYLVYSQKIHPIPLEKKKLLTCCYLACLAVCFSLWLNTINWNYLVFTSKIGFIIAMILTGFFVKIIDLTQIKKLLHPLHQMSNS